MTENEEKLTLKEYFILVILVIVGIFLFIYYLYIWPVFHQEEYRRMDREYREKEDPNGDN